MRAALVYWGGLLGVDFYRTLFATTLHQPVYSYFSLFLEYSDTFHFGTIGTHQETKNRP